MKKIIIGYLIFINATLVAGQDIYLHCGAILEVDSGKFKKEQTIVISGTKIKEILPGFRKPNSDKNKVVDLKKKTVLPGFIDLHVHIESEANSKQYLAKYTKNDADVAFQSAVYAERTLMAGFTTVRDLGGTGVNISLRNAISQGLVKGPRIITCGKAIATTGGHADPSNGSRKELMGNPGPDEGVVNSPEEARKAVRQRYKNGADVIKITATGGVLSVAKNGSNPQFTLDEIKAITSTAKDYGMLTAAHAHGDEGMQRAVLGGIKTIEHGTFMSDETMELMKKYNTFLVPTITAGKYVAEKAAIKDFYPAVVAVKAKEVGPQIQGTFARAYKKGVPIAFGTDAGVFPHGQNAKEFGYMVAAGMPALEALQSATLVNADLLGKQDQLGNLKPGYLADIIAVNENPVENINTLEEVVFVMKGGEIFKN